MSTFPENEVEIHFDYSQEGFPVQVPFQEETESVLSALSDAIVKDTSIVPSVPGGPLIEIESDRAKEINLARWNLQPFFQNGTIASENSQYWELLTYIREQFKMREFKRAQIAIGIEEEETDPEEGSPDIKLDSGEPISLPTLTPEFVELALTRTPIVDVVFTTTENPGMRPPVNTRVSDYPGYAGPTVDIPKLMKLYDLLANGPERAFRVGILSAESFLGRAKSTSLLSESRSLFDDAINEYAKLLRSSTSTDTVTKKFVAIRCALARLEKGDYLFRRGFRFQESEREDILKEYDEALVLMRSHNISEDNPLRQQIVDYAVQQKGKLDSGLNYLGYSNSYVPPFRLSTLEDLANSYITVAETAGSKFLQYKNSSDERVRELAEFNQRQREEEAAIEIARSRLEIARKKEELAEDTIGYLDNKGRFLGADLAVGLSKSILTTIATGGAAAAGGAAGGAGGTQVTTTISGPGITDSLVGYLAARNELNHQKKVAEIERRIARRNISIAELEKRIADGRLEFINDAITAHEEARFNADYFVALANFYEDMTNTTVDKAYEFLYLFERAVNFKRLHSEQIIERSVTTLDPFDALDNETQDPLIAPLVSRNILVNLKAKAQGDGRGQNALNLPPWSLRTRYPIEFDQLLQTAPHEMEFVISLYDVEKHMNLKGHRNIRIKKIIVNVVGLDSDTGYTGTLTHRGTTIFRDKETLLSQDPESSRFVPTDQQVTDAISDFETSQTDHLDVGGISLYTLEESSRRFTSEEEIVVTGQELDYDLEPIENYGLTGTWYIEITGTDLVFQDINLQFVVSLDEHETAVEERIDLLLDAYEAELANNDRLDQITFIALRTRITERWPIPQTGVGTLVLQEQDFSPDITDLKVKTVVAQVVAEDGSGLEGIAIEISHAESSFSLTKTTVTNGFSDDVDLEIPIVDNPDDRTPLLGTWSIRLPDSTQWEQVVDINLFFIYTYRGR